MLFKERKKKREVVSWMELLHATGIILSTFYCIKFCEKPDHATNFLGNNLPSSKITLKVETVMEGIVHIVMSNA